MSIIPFSDGSIDPFTPTETPSIDPAFDLEIGIPQPAITEADLEVGIPQPSMTEAFGENPWEAEEREAKAIKNEKLSKALTRIDQAALEPETYFKGKDLSFHQDPAQAQRIATVDAFLRLQNNGKPLGGSPIPGSDELTRSLTRQQIAINLFEGRGADDDDSFFTEIQKSAQHRKDRRALGKTIAEQANLYAITKATDPEKSKEFSWTAFRDAARKSTGYKPEDEADLYEAYHHSVSETQTALATFAPQLKEIWQAMKQGPAGNFTQVAGELAFQPLAHGIPKAIGEFQKKDAPKLAYDLYFKLTDEERPAFKLALSTLARTLPKEEQAAFFANLAKQSGRDIDRLMGNIASMPFTIESPVARSLLLGGQGESIASLADPDGYHAEQFANITKQLHYARNFASDIRDIEQHTYNPMKSAWGDEKIGIIEGGLYGAPGAIASSLLVAVPYLGVAAMFTSMEASAYDDIRRNLMASGMSDEAATEKASQWKTIAAVPQAALEKLQSAALLGKLPFLNKFFTSLGNKITSNSLRFGTRAATLGISETGIEYVQDLIPHITQDLATLLDSKIPSVTWKNGKDGALDGFWTKNLTTLVSMLPLALFGAAGGIATDQRLHAFQNASDNTLLALGASTEQLAELRAAQAAGHSTYASTLPRILDSLDPSTETAQAAVLALVEEEIANHGIASEATQSGILPRFTRTDSGWTLHDTETGEEIGTAPDAASALRLAITHTDSIEESDANRFAYMLTMLEAGDFSALSDTPYRSKTTVFSPGETVTTTQQAAISPEDAAKVASQVKLHEKTEGGDGRIAELVFGQNTTTFEDRSVNMLNRLNAGASILTVFHEETHGFFKEALKDGRITWQESLQFLRAIDNILDSKTTRTIRDGNGNRVDGGSSLRLLPADFDTLTEKEKREAIDEAISKVMEAEVLRTRKGKSGVRDLPAGIISRNLAALTRIIGGATTNKFRAFSRALREYFGITIDRAAHLDRALKDGTLDQSAYNQYLTKLLGLEEQQALEQQTRDYEAEILNGTTTPEALPEGDPFSIGRATVTPNASTRTFQGQDGQTVIGPASFSIGAWHGTPHKVSRFRLDKIGTGEGAQAYGYGLYFADSREVAEKYKSMRASTLQRTGYYDENIAALEEHLTRVPNDDMAQRMLNGLKEDQKEALKREGNLYKVNLKVEDEDLLDWDKAFLNQPENIKSRLRNVSWFPSEYFEEPISRDDGDYWEYAGNTYESRREALEDAGGFELVMGKIGGESPQQISAAFYAAGIKGIRYLDGNSRADGQGSYNYVIFNEADIEILEENGKPVNLSNSQGILDSSFSIGKNIPFRTARNFDEAHQAAQSFLSQPITNQDDSTVATLSANSLRKILNNKASSKSVTAEVHSLVTANLDTLFQRAIRTFTDQNPEAENMKARHRYHAPFISAGELMLAKLTVNEFKHPADGTRIYSVEALKIEKPAIFKASLLTEDRQNYNRVAGFDNKLNARMNEVKQFLENKETSFSLGPAAIADALRLGAIDRIKDPQRRVKAMSKVARNMEAIQLVKEKLELIHGAKRAKASLKKESAFREAALAEQYENEAYARHYGILEDDDLIKIKSQPVHAYLSDPDSPLRGVLMSKAQAIKQHPETFALHRTGEYDGSDGVSRSVFGGNRMPDQAAQDLYDEYLIKEPTADALWQALLKEQSMVASMKELHAAAKADIRAARAARTRAKQEVNQWLALDALAMLDAILSTVSPHIRGKVGGYTQLAKLGSNRSRLAYLINKLEKVDQLLESELRIQFDKEMKDLLTRARPKKDAPGEKPKGTAGANIHDLFREIEEYMLLPMAEAEARALSLEYLVESGELTPEQESHNTILAGLLRLTGAWTSADAARKEAAVTEATNVFADGYLKHQIILSAKREARSKFRKNTQAETKKEGNSETNKQNRDEEGESVAKLAKSSLSSYFSFAQTLGNLTEDGSNTMLHFGDWERHAANAKADALEVHTSAIESLLASLGKGGSFAASEIRRELQKKNTITIQPRHGKMQLSQMEAVAATLMWKQPDGKRHMEGHTDEAGNPAGEWNYTQRDIDNIESQLTYEAKVVRVHLSARYAAEYDRLNPVYRALNGINLPRNKFYSPLTVVPQTISTGQEVDPVTGFAMSSGSFSPASLKNRSQTAIAEPAFRDALSTYLGHVQQIEHYIAYASFNAEASAIFRDRKTRATMEERGGAEAMKALDFWLEYFNMGGIRQAGANFNQNKILSGMASNATSMALIGRMTVPIVQSVQLLASWSQMSTASYMKRIGKLFTFQMNDGYKAALNSPYMQRRLHDAPPSVRDAMNSLMTSSKGYKEDTETGAIFHKALRHIRHTVAQGGQVIPLADYIFTSASYTIIYDKEVTDLLKEDPTIEKEELHRIATENTERTMDTYIAQPMRPGARSAIELQAQSGAYRLMYNFISDPRQKIGGTIYKLKQSRGEKKALLAACRMAFVHWIAVGTVLTMIRAVMLDARSDEDDDEWIWDIKRLSLDTLLGPLSIVPFLGEEVSNTIQTAFGQRPMTGTLLSSLLRVPNAVGGIIELFQGESDVESAIKDIETLLNGIGLFSQNASAATSVTHLIRDLFRLADQAIK